MSSKVTPRDTRNLTGAPRQRRSGVWYVVVSVLFAAQVALGLHQFGHQLHFDLTAPDECPLCQTASGLVAPPPPVTIVPPVEVLFETVIRIEQPLPRHLFRLVGFQSRAPPISVSI